LSKALDREKVFLIFELVLYVRAKVEHSNADGSKSVVDTTKEYSCAHARTEVKNSHTLAPKKMVLPLHGGSPSFGTGAIDPAEVNRARTGLMNGIGNALRGRAAADAPSTITVTFNPIKATDHRAYHLKLMPSTCVLNSCILPFVSGFRNHTGKQLLKINQNRKPGGDVAMAMFPKLFDNIDILEEVACRFHQEFAKLNNAGKTNIGALGERVRELIYKLYPVLYATSFQYSEVSFSDSACANVDLYKER